MTRSQRHLREIQGVDSGGITHGPTNDPKQATVPTIAGTAQEGQTLTGTNGTFTGQGLGSITRAWLRDGAAISGATGATYVVQAADVGHKISFRNTVSNFFGTTSSVSAQTATVIAA